MLRTIRAIAQCALFIAGAVIFGIGVMKLDGETILFSMGPIGYGALLALSGGWPPRFWSRKPAEAVPGYPWGSPK